MSRTRLVGLLVVVVILGVSLIPTSAEECSGTEIRGTITAIRVEKDQSKVIGTVSIKTDKTVNAKLDKANLIITKKTRVFDQRGEQQRQAAFEDLRVGDTIEVQFVEGPTVMIYPLRVAAAEIVIVRGQTEK